MGFYGIVHSDGIIYLMRLQIEVLLDLFELFERLAEEKDIHVIWYHESDDDEMQEAGEELLDLVELSYEIKEM